MSLGSTIVQYMEQDAMSVENQTTGSLERNAINDKVPNQNQEVTGEEEAEERKQCIKQ